MDHRKKNKRYLTLGLSESNKSIVNACGKLADTKANA
jgi:hypothetical protein